MKGNAKCKNFRFEQPFAGRRGNVNGLSMARWKARCRLPISDNWFFLLALSAVALAKYVKIGVFNGGGVTLSANFR